LKQQRGQSELSSSGDKINLLGFRPALFLARDTGFHEVSSPVAQLVMTLTLTALPQAKVCEVSF